MSCSLEDIEKLIAKQSEALAKQRLEERAEDLVKFSAIIKTNVREEIHEIVEPLTKRQEAFETSTKQQFNDFRQDLAELKKVFADSVVPVHTPTSTQPTPPGPTSSTSLTHASHPPCQVIPGTPHPPNIRQVIEKAERTVGFQPLYKEDVDEICRVHSIDDTELAMKLLVLEYLKFEMKNTDTQLVNIVRVFPPNKSDWNTLYAEFDTRTTTRNVYGFTRFLRDGRQKLTKYIPQIFYDQFDHLSNLAYKYRLPPSNCKTRINFGTNSMFLQVKPPQSQTWQVVHVPDLPPLASCDQLPYLAVSPTLAPGRKSQTKRAASSSPESAPSHKSSRSTVSVATSRDETLPAESHTEDLISLDPQPSSEHFL